MPLGTGTSEVLYRQRVKTDIALAIVLAGSSFAMRDSSLNVCQTQRLPSSLDFVIAAMA